MEIQQKSKLPLKFSPVIPPQMVLLVVIGFIFRFMSIDAIRKRIVEEGFFPDIVKLAGTGASIEIQNLAARIIDNVCIDGMNKINYYISL